MYFDTKRKSSIRQVPYGTQSDRTVTLQILGATSTALQFLLIKIPAYVFDSQQIH